MRIYLLYGRVVFGERRGGRAVGGGQPGVGSAQTFSMCCHTSGTHPHHPGGGGTRRRGYHTTSRKEVLPLPLGKGGTTILKKEVPPSPPQGRGNSHPNLFISHTSTSSKNPGRPLESLPLTNSTTTHAHGNHSWKPWWVVPASTISLNQFPWPSSPAATFFTRLRQFNFLRGGRRRGLLQGLSRYQ